MTNKNAMITGGSAGIGLELAKVFLKDYDLILVARNLEKLEKVKALLLKESPNRSISIYSIDLTSSSQREDLFLKVPKVDLLINNAGTGYAGKSFSLTQEENNFQISLNCQALVSLCSYYGEKMLSSNTGKIVNISSMAAYASIPYFNVYAATKAFVLSYSEALQIELSSKNIKVFTICPGGVSTEFHLKARLSNKIVQDMANFMMEPKELAVFIEKSIKGNSKVFIPGISNQLTVLLLKLLPNKFKAIVASKIYQKYIN